MKWFRTSMAGLAFVGATAVAASPTVSADGAPPTIAAVLLADSARDDAAGFDRRWFDHDIVTQAVL